MFRLYKNTSCEKKMRNYTWHGGSIVLQKKDESILNAIEMRSLRNIWKKTMCPSNEYSARR